MQSYILKNNIELSAVVHAAFPAYRKTKAYLSVFPDHGLSINSYWDGGSKKEYVIVDLVTRQQKPIPTSTHPYFDIQRAGLAGAENPNVVIDERGGVTLKRLPDGFAIIQAGTSCGKPATAHVFISASNMPKFLQA